jgi:hypothetical protein
MRDATDLTIILDRSGSMAQVQSAMDEVLNGYVTMQKKLPGECRFTLVQFDDDIETPIDGVPLASVGKIVLEPRNATALLDAIGWTIDRTGKRLANMSEDERPNKVLIVVVTDGYENASHEYVELDPSKGPKSQKINNMVRHQREHYSWEFVFLGADQDAITSAAGMGFNMSNAINYSNTSGGVKGMGSRLMKMSSGYRSAKTAQAGGQLLNCCASENAQQIGVKDTEDWDAMMKQAQDDKKDVINAPFNVTK